MESDSDGRKFVEAAREVTQHKPVIALKVGRFESGQKAAASHTGALAASDVAFDAAFEKAGILRADPTEQMFDWARALENCPIQPGNNIAVLTNAGGPGVIAADSLDVKRIGPRQTNRTDTESIDRNPATCGWNFLSRRYARIRIT